MKRVALVVGVALACAAPARAEEVTLPKTKVVLHLADGWRRVATARLGDGLVAGATRPGGALAVTRARVPNAGAWLKSTRDGYLDQIARGALAAMAGARRVAKQRGEVHGVPMLDVTATRADGKTVVIRVLAFRTYALSLAIEGDADELPAMQAMISAFQPPA